MKIAYAASEITPYASTGGLAEVAAALPVALRDLGHQVFRFMPMYRAVMERFPEVKPTGIKLSVPLGFHNHTADIWRTEEPGLITYFIRRDEYFDRAQLYSLPDRDYDDNFERFVFFQKAVVALMDHLQLAPDVVHGNDWQCGLLPYYLVHGLHGHPRPRPEPFVFTIHNLAYQGIYPGSEYALTNLPFNCFSVNTLEFYGKINCLKGGVTGARVVNTVSPTYAREICSERGGFGLHGLMASLGSRLHGILNGMDVQLWDPSKDRGLVTTYSPENPAGKGTCRKLFLTEHQLKTTSTTLGMVTRMVANKGFDVLAEAMPDIMKRDVTLFILGSGEQKYQDLCMDWQRTWPEQFACHIGYEPALARRVLAASDFLLIPSRYEPCGLSQFYAQRYGALPIAHAVGGLADTITDVGAGDGGAGTGILMKELRPDTLLASVDRAIVLQSKPAAYAAVQKRAMRQDHAWTTSAKRYLELYASAVKS
jgi:starch synthase